MPAYLVSKTIYIERTIIIDAENAEAACRNADELPEDHEEWAEDVCTFVPVAVEFD
ncbi:MAG: hypothetical protein IE919_19700 [Thioclava sp.]|nr:hypothetical protein [Thioclava sp.]